MVAWEPLTKAQKRAVDRFFDEKLRFLSERHTILDSAPAKVLSYLHGYRNEAHHEGRVRSETLRTAALILFEANCSLLLTVFRIRSYASNEFYSWLQERFDLRRPFLLAGDGLQAIVNRLREPFVPTLDSVVAALSAHLTNRIDELLADLDFIVDGREPKPARMQPTSPSSLRPSAFGQIIELADVIGVEGLVASAAMPSSNLRGGGLRLRWVRDLVDLSNLLGR